MSVRRFLLLAACVAAALLAWGYAGAVAEPRMRTAKLGLAGWPAGAPPIRIVLLSDLHVAGPDMPPERLARILDRVASLDPDIVLIAGDFVSDRRIATRRYSLAEAVAPLKRLYPRLGSFAVLGNHDHWRDAAEARRVLAAAGIRVLDSHSPDPFPDLPADVSLMLAGHTHCGQIRLPLVGAISTMSRYGERYACGLVRENGKILIVGAGLGTSIAPLRIGAPPDFWVIDLSGLRSGGGR
jgi:predicted MPP superfamily phosphohydrolase